MSSPAPTPSRNRAAARAVVLAVADPGEARDVLEALGIITSGGRAILPDPYDLMLDPSKDEFFPLGGGDSKAPDLREPPPDRSLVPAGLRNYSAEKPTPEPAKNPTTGGSNPPQHRDNCGTRSGYRAHRANHERACLPCTDAERDDQRARRAAKPKKNPAERQLSPIEHGTYTGYIKERRRGLEVCQACRTASTVRRREDKKKQRERERAARTSEKRAA